MITLGRRGGKTGDDVAMPVVHTDRGGLATYHGPGQLVGYLIIDVARRRMGPRRLVDALEAGIIRWLDTIGIEARSRRDAPGVWVDDQKIAALGLHFSRGVSMHGFALNLEVDLTAYRAITPCGFDPSQVTSVRAIRGGRWRVLDNATAVGHCVRDAILKRSLAP